MARPTLFLLSRLGGRFIIRGKDRLQNLNLTHLLQNHQDIVQFGMSRPHPVFQGFKPPGHILSRARLSSCYPRCFSHHSSYEYPDGIEYVPLVPSSITTPFSRFPAPNPNR